MSRDARKHDVKLRAIGVIDLAKKLIVCNVPCKEMLCDAVTIRILLTHNEKNTAKASQNNDRWEPKTLTSLHQQINSTTLVLGYEKMRNMRAVQLLITYAWSINQNPTKRPS